MKYGQRKYGTFVYGFARAAALKIITSISQGLRYVAKAREPLKVKTEIRHDLIINCRF